MAMTLEELKAENAKAEEAAETQTEITEEEETEELSEETETEEEGNTEEESEENTEEEAEEEPDEDEEWKQGDSHESQDGKKFTDGDIGKAKAKLRAKLEKRHQEDVDKLKQELEELRSVAQKPAALAKPKPEDFDSEDDPDAAYQEALVDWKVKTLRAEEDAKTQAAQAKQKQSEYAKKVEAAVDQHYERAVKLAEKSGISAELYQGADLKVRQTIDSLYPEAGDSITDALIANLGEGSEKVIYNLGVNSKRLAELKSRLTDDPTGISAATYLGMLNAELTAPTKRKTRAPAPAPALNGDSNSSSGIKALKRQYDEAHKKGNMQSAFDAKRKAKAAGADTKDW